MEKGLTTSAARRLLEKNGANELPKAKRRSAAALFAGQFKDAMVLVLLGATAVSALMGEYADAVLIAAILTGNAFLGFIQEFRAEKTLQTLKALAAPKARVYRDGRLTSLPARELVVSDVVLLEAGGRIPADGTVTETVSLSCDESLLTGESDACRKGVGDSVYMGAVVTRGRAEMRVTAVGASAEMGKIGVMLASVKTEASPLAAKLAELSKIIGVACLAVCAVVVGIGIAGVLARGAYGGTFGSAVFETLFSGISLAVAAIPEGLPATVTISLALAVRRMYKAKALVNRLHSIETLGRANVILTDKTGTLTQNRMTAESFYGDRAATLLCAGICNDSIRTDSGNGKGKLVFSGEPTETALAEAAYAENPAAVSGWVRLSEVPFESASRYMSVTVRKGGVTRTFVKGAPDVVLKQCRGLTQGRCEAVLARAEEMAGTALRVLAFASDGVFCGLVGLRDPLRREAATAVAECRRAGIRVVMLTGDSAATAREIAAQAGIIPRGGSAVAGDAVFGMSDADIMRHSVFARISPAGKLRVVRAYKNAANITVMTGDGVNDAPAVKEAAVGVAMGVSGTDVTKEAADLVLLDDNFATLVKAVEQGRTVYANMRKFIRYMLSCNIGEVVAMLAAALIGLPVPLLPVQILLINLVTDGLPAIALGMENVKDDTMTEPPRASGESVFSGGLLRGIVARGVIIGLVTLAQYVLALRVADISVARTAAVLVLGLSQLAFVFLCKDERKGIAGQKLLDNKKLIAAVAVSLAILLPMTLVPQLAALISSSPLPPALFVGGVGFAVCAGWFRLPKFARRRVAGQGGVVGQN
ncbi:calcium-translocating P-type ATPase, PMCA-type [Clostridia bacterium]|nr:calcium-translocating P-type ATPase, PMCA-type [Clostridia bacterium]